MNVAYKLVKNCMPATAAAAPYLGMAIPVGSLAYDNILGEMIARGTKMSRPTAKYFLDALYEYAAERIAREAVRINLGSVSVYPSIEGSFDSEDADFDPARNALVVGASLSQEIRDRVAGVVPDFAGEGSAGTVKLHSCMDMGSQTFKAIDGANPFRLAGANLTVPDGPDESLALYDRNGVDRVCEIEVRETDGGQRIVCALRPGAAAVPAGAYKVRLCSHGLDPTDTLTVTALTVTLLADVPAAPHVPTAEWEGSLGTSGGELTVGGEAGAQLAALYEDDPSAAYARVKFTDPDGEEITCPMQAADGRLAVSASVAEGCQAGDVYTLAVQVEDSAGTLVTLSHEYTVTEV